MSPVKFNGNGNLPSLLDEFMGRDMDELFNFNRNWPGITRSQMGTLVPAVNIREDADGYQIDVAAPGMKKDDFSLSLHNGKRVHFKLSLRIGSLGYGYPTTTEHEQRRVSGFSRAEIPRPSATQR